MICDLGRSFCVRTVTHSYHSLRSGMRNRGTLAPIFHRLSSYPLQLQALYGQSLCRRRFCDRNHAGEELTVKPQFGSRSTLELPRTVRPAPPSRPFAAGSSSSIEPGQASGAPTAIVSLSCSCLYTSSVWIFTVQLSPEWSRESTR